MKASSQVPSDPLSYNLYNRLLTHSQIALDADVRFVGAGEFRSAFAVTDFAAATIAFAAASAGQVLGALEDRKAVVTVDRRLASFWCSSSFRPVGWTPSSPWDPLAGDYQTSDGWIRLHTNAPAHKKAALRVLGVDDNKDAVAASVASLNADELEEVIVAAGGCAAKMRTAAEWSISKPGAAVKAEPLIQWATYSTKPNLVPRNFSARAPLRGLKVLDLTRVLAGPVCTRFLAGLGANVLRIDPPAWDEPAVLLETMAGKRSTTLNLHNPRQRTRFVELLADCDVLVHGYRPAALVGLGFHEEERRRINPGLIDVSLNAYGWSGPWSARRGFDSLVQMSCGIAHAGMQAYLKGRPTPLPFQALDHGTGYLMAAAVLQAVVQAVEAGVSTSAQLSLARTALLLMEFTSSEQGEVKALGEGDFEIAIEETGWGPLNRLRQPFDIDGLVYPTSLPAMPLGTHAPQF